MMSESVEILPGQYAFIRGMCARRLSAGRGREPPDPWLTGALHVSSFFLKLKLSWGWKMQIFSKTHPCDQFEVLPASWLATNEMSLGVFQLLFMLRFLWNAGIGWTIPKPDFLWVFATDKSPLLHKHSPSCWNLILKHFSAPIVELIILKGAKCPQPSHLLPSLGAQLKTLVVAIYWT